MIAPDINAAPVCCEKCRQPVQITCVEHGVDCVIALRPLPPQAHARPVRESRQAPVKIPAASKEIPLKIRRAPRGDVRADGLRVGTVGAAIVDGMSSDVQNPTTIDALEGVVAVTRRHISVELVALQKRCLVRRVGAGLYVRVA